MLTHLSIRNYTLADSLELDLAPGMTVVTGETGAGKSIMLDALGMSLGDRADSSVVGPAGDRAEVVSSFDIATIPAAARFLHERELTSEDDQLILRRVISRDGRSRAFINGTPTTIADIRELGQHLVDIHSQHEHQSLLQKDTHRRLLDEHGKLQADASRIEALYLELRAKTAELATLRHNSEQGSARLQLLQYQAEELNLLDLAENEVANLATEHKALAHADSHRDVLLVALEQIGGDQGLLGQLQHQVTALAGLDSAALTPTLELMSSSTIELEEALSALRQFADGLNSDPARLSEVEARLDAIYSIARKHRIEPEQLPQLQASISEELAAIEHIDADIDATSAALDLLRGEYDKLAAKLSKARGKAAKAMQKKIGAEFERLGMAGAALNINIVPTDGPGLHGIDDIEFMVTTNPGQAPGPLRKIASGGELSRISLAIQVIAAGASRTPTLVFDEVDVGIGGATAEVVGAMLRALGDGGQVICVTHQAQVASQGHQHLQVSKKTAAKKTSTAVAELDEAARVSELARMLGGIEVTQETTDHAREMYKRAQASA